MKELIKANERRIDELEKEVKHRARSQHDLSNHVSLMQVTVDTNKERLSLLSDDIKNMKEDHLTPLSIDMATVKQTVARMDKNISRGVWIVLTGVITTVVSVTFI